MMKQLIFLKLGGSLITDKNLPRHARMDVLERLAGEIALVIKEQPDLKLLLGHGSGSFGHIPANHYKTRDGVSSSEQWRGFTEVWHEARALNSIVMETLRANGIPAVAFPPCAQVLADSHKVSHWETTQITRSIAQGIMPVVYGDVVFDREIGGTILSTEEQFEYLAADLKPARILLAGIENGVWKDFPLRNEMIDTITPRSLSAIDPWLASSISPDVTGGMRSKIHSMMNLILARHCQEVLVFSGTTTGNVYRGLKGEKLGTRISLE